MAADSKTSRYLLSFSVVALISTVIIIILLVFIQFKYIGNDFLWPVHCAVL